MEFLLHLYLPSRKRHKTNARGNMVMSTVVLHATLWQVNASFHGDLSVFSSLQLETPTDLSHAPVAANQPTASDKIEELGCDWVKIGICFRV